MDQPLVWMNGTFLEYASAKVSVEDRGFLFSDGIYEVIRGVDGRFFAFEQHLQRMHRSLRAIEIDAPVADAEIRSIAEELLLRSGESSASLYIQITRGTAPRTHAFPIEVHPTTLVLLRRFNPYSEISYQEGVRAITVTDDRWQRCDIKTIGLLPNVLAKERAKRAKATEAILIRDGIVTEGASSNVFILAAGHLITPPADHRILRGVTRDVILNLAAARQIPVMERPLTKTELYQAEEVFLTSTTMEVLPVIEMDHTRVGSGRPGSVTQSLLQDYRNLMHAPPTAVVPAPAN